MNKRFLSAALVIFVVWMMGSFVVHGLLLQPDYARHTALFRTEAESQKYFPLMLLAHLILSAAFVWIYGRGVTDRPWPGQGLRFGAAVAFLTTVPTYTIYYVVQPLAGATAVKQIVFDSVLIVVLGLVVAFLHRKPART